MALATNQYIYRIEWRGSYTKWDYRLDIIIPPEGYPDGLDLANPIIVKLPIEAIILQKANINYPDYFGAPEIPTLDLNIDLRKIQNRPELIKALTTPAIIYTSDAGNIEAGVVFHLYIKYNGNDTATPIDYRLFKSYIHYADGSFKYTPTDAVISIQAVDLNFAILRSLSFNQLDYNDFGISSANNIIELYSLIESMYFAFVHNGGEVLPLTYHFVPFNSLGFWIINKATIIKKLLLRNSNATDYSIDAVLPTLYKQNANPNGVEGDRLSGVDINLLAYIKNGDDIVAGLFYDKDPQSLQQTYPNSVADFYNELAEFNLCRIKSGDTGLSMVETAYLDTTLDINHLYDLSFSINEEKVKSVTASLYEKNTDADTQGDIDKFEATIQGSRNEASWTLPIVFNNILTNIKREPHSGTGVPHRGNTTLIKNLFYYDVINSNPSWLRVHEYAKFLFEYKTLGSLSSTDLVSKNLISRDYEHPPITALGTQLQSGIPYILSNYTLKLLQGGMDIMECMVDMNYLVSFTSIIEKGNPWLLPIGNEYHFNLTNYAPADPFMSDLANHWKLISSEFDFLKETIKVKFIRLKINQIT